MHLKTGVNIKNLKNLVIAIDGPAASGKSTTAKLVAERLGYLYVDTGAMYRAMTLKALENNMDLHDEQAVGAMADGTVIRLEHHDHVLRVILDNRDVTEAIRRPEVTRNVSAVSAIKRVREAMVREQRRMGERGGIVLEGRDIGTVVFPDADVKIFMVANLDERAKRRGAELKEKGIAVSLEELKEEIIERDQKDSAREVSPLRKAADAVVIDTSRLTIGEQVDRIVKEAETLLHRGS